MNKKCYTCKQIKLIIEFYKNRTSKDGLQYDCKLCHNISNKKYTNKLRVSNPQKLKDRWKKNVSQWRANNPDEYKELNKKHQQTWRDLYPELNRERSKQGGRALFMYRAIIQLASLKDDRYKVGTTKI